MWLYLELITCFFFRRLEIKYITKASYVKGISLAIMVFTERCILYLILTTYVLFGNRLTSDVVFSMAQLINAVQLYMCLFFPRSLATYAEAIVTIKKLENFLLLEENPYVCDDNEQEIQFNRGLIQIDKAQASWLPNPTVKTLINVNLTIPPGTLL